MIFMKQLLKYALLFLGITVTATSCQKVIDINLKKADQRYIIDALITDQLGYNYVTISKSKPFDENNDFERIHDATVWVKDLQDNTIYPFTVAPLPNRFGYNNVALAARTGSSYELYIALREGDTLTATCTVPDTKVMLDTITIERSEFSMFLGRDIYVGVPVYKDPPGRGNYYLLKSYLNGVNTVSASYDTDEFIDGQVNKSPIFFRSVDREDENAVEFKNGDTLGVELYCISKPVYEFYFTLGQNGSGAISNPANPRSNVYGKNVIGVFNAATISRKSIIAKY